MSLHKTRLATLICASLGISAHAEDVLRVWFVYRDAQVQKADFLDTWDYNKEIAKYADKLIPINTGPLRSDDSTMVVRPIITPPNNTQPDQPKVCEKDPRLPPDCRCPYYDEKRDMFIMCP
jgi:hypothetical protein